MPTGKEGADHQEQAGQLRLKYVMYVYEKMEGSVWSFVLLLRDGVLLIAQAGLRFRGSSFPGS